MLVVDLLRLTGTTTYSESEVEGSGSDSPSLAPGVGGRAPGIFCLPNPSVTFPSLVCGRETWLNSEDRGLLGPWSARVGEKVSSPRPGRGRGLDLPFGEGDVLPKEVVVGVEGVRPAFFRRSSVALRRASRASSSEVCEETAFFLPTLSVGT
jgi:hypothetical protein